MNTPTQEQFQTVISNLEKSLLIAKSDAPVDMGEGSIVEKKQDVCGTPACHGGWYAIATYQRLRGKNFDDGAKKMAKHLGFKDESELQLWASQNITVWGNTDGYSMFTSKTAFGFSGYKKITLKDIIDHWKGVKERAAKSL